MNIQQDTINGLKTVFVDQPGSQAASVQIWFRAGSSLENYDEQGIAHFLEHMFFKGTKKRPGAKIASDIESYGGEVNAFTSFDYTCYYINSPAHKLKSSIEILMDMVANPEFKNTEIPPERGVVFEEFLRSQDNPNQYNFQRIQKNCFMGGYKHPILGREKTIKSFSRKQLVDFRKRYYNLHNSMLIVAGDLKNTTSLKKEVAKFKLPKGPESIFKEFNLKKSPQVMVSQKPVRMVTTTLCIQAPEFENYQSALEDLALNVLGYGETSIMHQRLVLKNSLCNGASASTMFFSKGGIHFIRFVCPEENLKKAITEFTKLIRETLEQGLTMDDIEKIKNQYLSYKIYEKETLESFAFSLGHGFAQNGDIHCEREFLDNIKSAKVNEVNQGLKDLLSRPIHINIQAPQDADVKNIEKVVNQFKTTINSLNIKVPKKTKSKQSSNYDPKVIVHEIKPGIKLIHRQNEMTPTFNLYTFIRGGLTEETIESNGIHHVLASLLTKGNESLAFTDLKRLLENKSSSLQGFAGKNSYGINMHGLTEFKDELFDAYFDSLLKPTFDIELFELEKKLLLRSLETHEEDPIKQCFKIVSENFFNNHPYSMRVIGTKESVEELKQSSLIDTHSKNLKTKEMVITYCGDLDFEIVKGIIEKKVSSLDARDKKPIDAKNIDNNIKNQIHKTMDREQTQILIGHQSYKFGTKEDLYLKILTTHLQGQSSELFVDVRDTKGLCYVVQPINFSAIEGGYWGIYMASGNGKEKQAIEAINEILHNLATKGFSASQFNRVKKMIQGQELLNVQTNEDYVQIYSVPVLQGFGVDFHHKRLEQIQKIKLEEFNKFLAKFLKTKKSVITVGRD